MSQRKYITGIDGLRTMAVLGVIIYHLWPKVLPGGFLGVPLFFVISGFLMTDILYRSWMLERTMHLKRFYTHRIRRLMPSLMLMFIISGSIFVFLPGHLLNQFRQTVLSSIFYVNNWWQLASDHSYFAKFTDASPYAHLWSLSIEGQFYLLWPLIMGIIMYFMTKNEGEHFVQRRDYFLIGLTATIILSALGMGIFYSSKNVSAVYYNTFTRLFSLLLGCLLAMLIHNKRSILNEAIRQKGTWLSIGCIVLIIWCYLGTNDQTKATYYGGMLIFSVVSMLLLMTVLLSPNANRLLTNPLFHYIGTRSYEIYLWQYPVMIAYEQVFKLNGSHPIINGVIELMIILVLSEVTYRLWPLLRQLWRDLRHISSMTWTKATIALMAVSLLFMSTFTYAFVTAPKEKYENKEVKTMLASRKKEVNKVAKTKKEKQVAAKKQAEAKKQATQVTLKDASLTQEEVNQIAQMKITAIGDSVLLGTSYYIQALDPNCYIDAVVGRHPDELGGVLHRLNKEGKLADTIVICLGTNGEVDTKKMMAALKPYKDRHLYLMTVSVPRPWEKESNDAIETVAKKLKATVIPWYTFSLPHRNEWFVSDSVHLNKMGCQNYGNLLFKTILEQQHIAQKGNASS